MILSLGVLGSLALGALYLNSTTDYRFKKNVKYKWEILMNELCLQNNTSKSTYTISDIEDITNGYIFTISIPPGLTFTQLEEHKEAIESDFKGIITLNKNRFSNSISLKLITQNIGNVGYEPVELPSHILYIGKKLDTTNAYINICKASHILIGGATGTGKTFLLSTILTNLIYNSKNDIELHLSQIMKGEIGLFANCKPVSFIGYTLKEVANDLAKVAKIVNDRSHEFTSLGVKNLQHYNEHYPTKQKKRIFYAIEELSFFMPNETDDEITTRLKSICWKSILTIVKAGRSSGCHFLSATQRSTCTNLPSDVKSQLCRITMRQISTIDSMNIIECEDATKLQDLECLCYGTGEEIQPIKIPFVDEDFRDLQKWVKEIKVPVTINNKVNENKPILVNNGIPKELPLYIPTTSHSAITNKPVTTKITKESKGNLINLKDKKDKNKCENKGPILNNKRRKGVMEVV